MLFRRQTYQQRSDEALMELVRKGQLRALETLYERYADRLRYYFFRLCGQDAALAADLCQELFVRLAERRNQYRPGAAFRPWIFSMANNLRKNHYRHMAVRERARTALQEEQAVPAATPPDEAHVRELLDRFLADLPEEQHEAFLLRHREGLTNEEVAEIQGVPVGTVKSRLHHATQQLAQALAPYKQELMEGTSHEI